MKLINANVELRTSNFERRTKKDRPAKPHFDVRRSTFDVRCSHLILSALALLFAINSIARADDPGISVSGTATIKAKPTELQIVGTISGEGEVANDASVKFHDLRKKALAALDGLKNPDLSVESLGSDVHDSMDPQQQMRMMQGQSTDTGKVRTQISERLCIKLKNIDKLEADKLLESTLKLVDTCRDAGLSVGSTPTNYYQWQMQQNNGGGGGDALVQFKIPDTTDLQNQACKQAIEDARAKAQRIADMTGVKLGKVLSVKDYGVTDSTPGATMMNGYTPPEHAVTKEASTGSIGDIPLTVKLQVQFEIEK
jgi:uncharacterized protein YggE